MDVDVTDAQRPRRVFVVDEHTVVRAGVRMLLGDEPDLVVVGEAANVAEFVSQSVAFDVVIADPLALGHTNAEVAGLLGVSLRTVESRRARVFGRLGLRTRAELFRYAADIGILNRSGLGSPHRG